MFGYMYVNVCLDMYVGVLVCGYMRMCLLTGVYVCGGCLSQALLLLSGIFWLSSTLEGELFGQRCLDSLYACSNS